MEIVAYSRHPSRVFGFVLPCADDITSGPGRESRRGEFVGRVMYVRVEFTKTYPRRTVFVHSAGIL